MSVEVNIEQVFINKANKEDLISLASKCQQRTFSEEVNFLEELGGNRILNLKNLTGLKAAKFLKSFYL